MTGGYDEIFINCTRTKRAMCSTSGVWPRKAPRRRPPLSLPAHTLNEEYSKLCRNGQRASRGRMLNAFRRCAGVSDCYYKPTIVSEDTLNPLTSNVISTPVESRPKLSRSSRDRWNTLITGHSCLKGYTKTIYN
eukprot:scaffold578352_cov45-Prasinocladus_malaysianus.AAC.1